MLTYVAILILPWLIALALTPLAIRGATAAGWLDHPTERKCHERPVPLLGGVALFASVALGLALLAPIVEPIRAVSWGPGSLGALGAGAAAMVLVGLYDDLRGLEPAVKLSAQICVAAVTWMMGFQVNTLPIALELGGSAGMLLSLCVTVAWIVVVTNAFTLIDGVDGLACGISIIAALTVFLLANPNAATVPVIGALALSGALSAFLRFNLPPARIFLGDSGSMGIGYTTAVLALASAQKAPTGLALIVPLLVFGLPMLDTTLTILRRSIEHLKGGGRPPFALGAVARAVFRADRGHIHHLLLRWGFSVSQTLGLLYAVSAALASLGLWSRRVAAETTWLLWLGFLLLGLVVVRLIERRVASGPVAKKIQRMVG